MPGAPVLLKLSPSPREDTNAWMTAQLHTYAETLGVKLKGEHQLVFFSCAEARTLPAQIGAALVCSCGWRKDVTALFLTLAEPLTTRSAALHDALKEHVLGFTDPTHYTYYPQGV